MATLLSRLRAPESIFATSGAEAATRASVLEHLKNMCRTRRGSIPSRPDYGLPDLGELTHAFPDALSKLRDALLHTIETYEPRLTNVRITHVPSTSLELMVRFEIRASLVDSKGGSVRFETQMTASRSINVV